MVFLKQRLIYTIHVWFNLVFGSFFEQDHLLNLIIWEVYAKRWPKCARPPKQKLMQSKIWSMIFFLISTVGGLSHKQDFKWKKNGRSGLIFEKKPGSFISRA